MRELLGVLINSLETLGYPVWEESGAREDLPIPCVLLRLENGGLTVTGWFDGENQHGAAVGFCDQMQALYGTAGTVLPGQTGLHWVTAQESSLRRQNRRTAGIVRCRVRSWALTGGGAGASN